MTAPAPHIYEFSQKPDHDFALIQRMQDTYERSITMNQAFWAEADIDARFKAGDENLWNEVYGQIPAFRRKLFSFNRIRRICNLISGHQRANRKSMIAIPVEATDAIAADQFTKVLMWCAEREGMLQTISEAFEGAITSGMNLLSLWIDFQSDPINGNIKLDNVSYNGYLIDPFFKNPDLSDCEFVWTRKWVTRAQAKALLPFRKKQIDDLTPGTADGKFQFMPQSLLQGYENHYLAYDEYWYKTTRKQKLLVDMRSGQTLEWRGSKTDLDFFLQMHPNIEVVTNHVPTCKLGIVVQGRVLYHGKNPMGIDSYPFVPVFAYRDPSLAHYALRCRSVVSGLRSAQSLYDHRKRVELDLLESQVSSGFKFKENALLNPKDVFLHGSGRGIALKQEANMEDVQAIQPPDVPQGMMQLSQQLATEIQEISGVNEELLGTAEDDRGVGLVSQLRQGAGLTTLRTLFDQLDHAQKILGRTCIDMIQNNFSAGKVERIIGQQPVAQFFNRDFGKFDVSIEDGLNTTTQKQIYFRQLLELKQMGIPIPNQTLIKSSTLQNKKELMEDIAQEEQRTMAIAKQKSDLEDEKARAEIKSLIGMGQAQAGLAIERGARTQENRAMALERLSSSEKEKETALLNRIKAIKELESIDLEKLKKLIEITDMVESREKLEEEKDRLQVVSPNPEEVAALTGTPESLVARKNVKQDLYKEKPKKKLPLETINEKPKEVTDGL